MRKKQSGKGPDNFLKKKWPRTGPKNCKEHESRKKGAEGSEVDTMCLAQRLSMEHGEVVHGKENLFGSS